MHEFISQFGSWPPKVKAGRPLWGLASVLERLPGVFRSHSYDLTFLQREMLSTYVTVEPLTKAPRIFDVDDAIWLHKRGQNIKRVVSLCERVLCGNAFIADAFSQWHRSVYVFPTGVDTDRYAPMLDRKPIGPRVIGWSGLNAGAKYLLGVEPALAVMLGRNPDTILRVVSDSRPAFRYIPSNRIDFIYWSPENEVRTIQEMTVGLMPLDDSDWSRGKCSYKMLLYMACGIPVIVSPAGMNAEILAKGKVGLGPRSGDEWVDAIEHVLNNEAEANQMGQEGRRIVLANYSLNTLVPLMAGHFNSCCGQHGMVVDALQRKNLKSIRS